MPIYKAKSPFQGYEVFFLAGEFISLAEILAEILLSMLKKVRQKL